MKEAAEELGLAGAHAREVGARSSTRSPPAAPTSAWWSRSASCCPSRCSTRCPHGFVNVHFSLLPRWRGAAPVERAMLAGDAETGVCIMALEAGLDTGPVYARVGVPIGAHETAGELRARLVTSAPSCWSRRCPRIPGTTPVPQSGEPTYADKLTVDEFALDWEQSAEELARVVRGGQPAPGRVDHRPRRPAEDLAGARRCRRASTPSPAPCSGTRASRPARARSSWSRCNPRAAGSMAGERLAGRSARARRPARYVSGAHERRHGERARHRAGRRARRARADRGRRVRARRAARDARRSRTSPTATAPSPPSSSTARCARSAGSTTCSATCVKRPIARLDPPVRAALRLGAYQLLHDTPPHAAVASTVDAVGRAFAARPRAS